MRAKNVGKKSSGKSGKYVFYIHTNIVTKRVGKKARNKFSRNTRIVRAKNFGKKVVGIMIKNVSYIHTDIVTKKWGKKTHESICPETHE